MGYWYQIKKSKAKQTALSGDFFLFIPYFENSTGYEIKGAKYNFPQKKDLFSEFRGKCYITEFSS